MEEIYLETNEGCSLKRSSMVQRVHFPRIQRVLVKQIPGGSSNLSNNFNDKDRLQARMEMIGTDKYLEDKLQPPH